MEAFKHKQIFDLLVEAKHPVFISDERVDGDSLGSSLALVDWMSSRGHLVPVIVTHAVPAQYQTLPHIEACSDDLSILDDPSIDIVVTFDCSDGEYIKSLVERIPANVTVINIDHHDTNPHYGDVNQVVVEAGSTADVVYRFFLASRLNETNISISATCRPLYWIIYKWCCNNWMKWA